MKSRKQLSAGFSPTADSPLFCFMTGKAVKSKVLNRRYAYLSFCEIKCVCMVHICYHHCSKTQQHLKPLFFILHMFYDWITVFIKKGSHTAYPYAT